MDVSIVLADVRPGALTGIKGNANHRPLVVDKFECKVDIFGPFLDHGSHFVLLGRGSWGGKDSKPYRESLGDSQFLRIEG